MPIAEIEENMRMPVIGKIRLGIRKKSSKGNEYPSETEYFVLKDAPEVAKIYGDEPTELDAYFPADDEELVIPYYYKWFAGGIRDKEGNVIGGKLQCYGDGKIAHEMAKRDPTTRVVPTRECKGPNCPDWSKNGTQQCKPSMNVFVMLPRVSLLGVYQIDTTSWNTIRKFAEQVNMIKKAWNRLTNIPFTIYREATPISFYDNNGKEQRRVHHIMKIKPNEGFVDKYGAEVQKKVEALAPKWKPEQQQLLEAPMEDNFAVTHEKLDNGEVVDAQKAITDRMTEVAGDPDLASLFSQLCEKRGAANTPKTRLLTARKFENEQDPKASLKAYLESQLQPKQQAKAAKPSSKKTATKKTAQKTAAPPPTQEAPPPPTDGEGLI